jgi:alpha-L-rhamnosidase
VQERTGSVKTNIYILALLLTLNVPALADNSKAISVYDLRVEHLENPLQLDVREPRLSWKIRATEPDVKHLTQQSYHILVASNPQLLADDQGDLWDSGQVESDQSVLVPYLGKPLSSRQACYWKVRVTDNQGHQSGWSDSAKWKMALLDPSDWSGSKWIGLREKERDHELASREHVQLKKELQSHTSPLLRKEIVVGKSVRKAMAYISGIGYSEFYINGKKIGDHVLDPGQTNYEKHTLYVVHDVTDSLAEGTNALGVWLGNGFYGQNLGFMTKFGYGQPSVRVKLFVEYSDGTTQEFGTDTTWKATPSPIVFDNVYWGESYDARLEIPGWSEAELDDSTWQAAVEVPSPCPDEQLRAQLIPPIKEVERLKPVEVRKVAPGTWLFDFGKNIAGWVEITVNQKAGDVIKMFPAEVVTKDPPRADQVTYGGAPGRPHELFYVCKGGGEESWAPRFTYTGFQYVEISGLDSEPDAGSVQAVFVRSAIEKTGNFSCSHELLNQQYKASLLSMEGNVHSLPEDCPHREKCGWLGDAHATADLCLYNYDIFRFYAKYNRDIQDSLIKRYNDGSGTFKIGERKSKVPKELKGIPTFVAPGKRSARLGSIDWGVAYLILPWRMYLHTGDAQSFEPHYEHVKDFISFFRTYKNEDGVIDNGLGDWCPPRWDRRKAPEFMECHPFVSGTAFYYQALKIAGAMADVLDDQMFGRQCQKEAEEIKAAFNNVYLKPIENSNLKHFGSQTATVMALRLGMVDSADAESRVEALVHDINHRHDGHHSCGIHGQRHLYSVLAEHGQDELAYKMLTDTTFPSPGYVLSCGLSTWPERRFEWKKVRYSNSFNHPMNGGFAAFMHESLGGIQPDPQKPGYQHFVLKPHLTDQLDWTNATIESPYGKIRSDWKNEADTFVWEIEVPPNSTATVFIPCSETQEVKESDQAIELENKTDPITSKNHSWRRLNVGSGLYRFIVK